ncbi:F-box/kelch-repeat protein [Arabidopsis thaliana]|uniref:F-box domain-containing protein n=2 Tax=Arabidopsis TaxID=3701 RepID=A0A178V3S1_ARATH|nr:F-box domain [Arabidopsis thaliana x Arabidopsis arenosa]OAP00947.1 hypothetical protein AXX17_AT4G44970 [Arabidopsis thaliana]
MFPMSSTSRSSAANNRKDPPRKKNKQTPSPVTREPTSIDSLPNDLLLNCFARVSRMYYPALSRVSKRFRSIVTSPEIYNTRSLLNRTEKCLYLCLRFPFDNNTYWFTLYQNPNQTVSDKVFLQIPSPQYPLTLSSNLVAVGSNIYRIGGTVGDDSCPLGFDREPSSKVSILDCRSHTWRDGPRMRLNRRSSTTSVVDGKIYVTGGTEDTDNPSHWIEVFDPKIQSWGTVTNPHIVKVWEEVCYRRAVKSIGHDGKLYLSGDKYVVYDPDEGKWNSVEEHWLIGYAIGSSNCVVDNILFYWDQGVFKWYDSKVSSWKQLKGLEGLPDDFSQREYCKLVDLGGKMAVLWDKWEYSGVCMIFCAEISLEKRDGDEIWGKVEWFDTVLEVGASCSLKSADALSASV